MDDETKRELEKAIAADKKNAEAKSAAAQQQKNAKQERETAWRNHIANTLVPALEDDMLETIDNAGWVSSATQEDLNLLVRIRRGNMRAAGGAGSPELRFQMDIGGRINIYHSTPGLSGSDNHAFGPEEMTVDFVEKRVLKFFQTLTRF
jgi:hypothetical protein